MGFLKHGESPLARGAFRAWAVGLRGCDPLRCVGVEGGKRARVRVCAGSTYTFLQDSESTNGGARESIYVGAPRTSGLPGACVQYKSASTEGVSSTRRMSAALKQSRTLSAQRVQLASSLQAAIHTDGCSFTTCLYSAAAESRRRSGSNPNGLSRSSELLAGRVRRVASAAA